MTCSNCQAALAENDVFCNKCGTKVNQEDSRIPASPEAMPAEHPSTAAAVQTKKRPVKPTQEQARSDGGKAANGKKDTNVEEKKMAWGWIILFIFLLPPVGILLLIWRFFTRRAKRILAIGLGVIAVGAIVVAVFPHIISGVGVWNKERKATKTFDMYTPVSWTGKNTDTPTDFLVTADNLIEANIRLMSMVSKGLDRLINLGDTVIAQEVEPFDSSNYTNLDPATSIIYPGALIRGDSLFTDDYTLLTMARNPIELTSNFYSANVDSIVTIVDDPKFSTVTTAKNQLVEKNLTSNVAANIEFYGRECSDEREARIAVGASLSLPPVISQFVKGVGGSIGASRTTKKTSLMLKYTQTYYTLSIHPPENPIDFFNDGFNMAALGDLSPAYVSEVSYGRMGILSITSNYSASEIKAALEAEVGVELAGISADVGVNVGGGYKKVLEESEINLYIIGGSEAQAGVAVNGYNGFMEFIAGGNNLMEEKKYAVPISYKLRYVSDNTLVPGGMATSTRRQEHNPENMKITVTLNYIDTSLDELQFTINTTTINAVTKRDFYVYTIIDKVLSKHEPIELLYIGQDNSAFLDLSNITYTKTIPGWFTYTSKTKLYGIDEDRIVFSDWPIGTSQHQIRFAAEPDSRQPVLTLNLTVKKEAVEKTG